MSRGPWSWWNLSSTMMCYLRWKVKSFIQFMLSLGVLTVLYEGPCLRSGIAAENKGQGIADSRYSQYLCWQQSRPTHVPARPSCCTQNEWVLEHFLQSLHGSQWSSWCESTYCAMCLQLQGACLWIIWILVSFGCLRGTMWALEQHKRLLKR